MSRIIVILSFCCILAFELLADESETNLWQKWTETVLKRSEESQKLILLKVVRDDCYYCTYMNYYVFNQVETSTYIKKHFIPVAVNISHESMPLGLKASMTPSFYILTADKKVVKNIRGAWTNDDFKALMHTIVKGQKQ